MKWVLCVLVSLSFLLGLQGPAKAGYIFTTLDPPGSTLTQANGINDAGQIVGMYRPADALDHGFLLSARHYTTIDVPGATELDPWPAEVSTTPARSWDSTSSRPAACITDSC